MKTKGNRVAAGNGNRAALGLASILFFCICFFLAGFLAAIIFSHQERASNWRPRMRKLAEERITEYETLHHGVSGEAFVESIPFQILSWKPRALYFPNFATAKQCKRVIEMAKKQLKPSSLALRPGETEADMAGVRTSSGMFISAREDETRTLDQIEEKIAKITMIPRSHGESFNVLRYEIGQLYDAHYDAFNPEEYGPVKSQRVATFLLYLSDVEEGGETMFPYENGQNMDSNYDFHKCIGLRIKPRMGDGLLFYSLLQNGTIDPTSIHGSCPVIRGEKWVATKWMRDREDLPEIL